MKSFTFRKFLNIVAFIITLVVFSEWIKMQIDGTWWFEGIMFSILFMAQISAVVEIKE